MMIYSIEVKKRESSPSIPGEDPKEREGRVQKTSVEGKGQEERDDDAIVIVAGVFVSYNPLDEVEGGKNLRRNRFTCCVGQKINSGGWRSGNAAEVVAPSSLVSSRRHRLLKKYHLRLLRLNIISFT
jgi:hypothetical protein